MHVIQSTVRLNIQVGEYTWYVLNEGGPGGNYIPIQVTVL